MLVILILIFVAIMMVAIFKSISEAEEHAENLRQEEEKRINLINAVISEAPHRPTEALISQRDEIYRAFDELKSAQRTNSMKTKEMVWLVIDGKLCPYGMDINTCYTLLKHLNQEIERRRKM